MPTDNGSEVSEGLSRALRLSGQARGPGDPGSNVEAFPIGPRLRQARLRLHLSLEQVAKSTGLTKGFISQLERGTTSASVASLLKLCDAVNLSIRSLFDGTHTMLVPAGSAPLMNLGGTGLTEYLLTARANSEIAILRTHVEPGGGDDEPQSFDAKVVAVYLLEGSLRVTIEGEVYELLPGDTLSFSPQRPHSFHNLSMSDRAVVLWVLTPSPW
jgi:transcriptional regulator with XRE-family HTH domain